MSEKERFLKFISQFDMGVKRLNKIIQVMPQVSIDNLFKIKNIGDYIKAETLELMKERASERNLRSYFEALETHGIQFITQDSKDFPKKLREIGDAPLYLFCKGDLSLLNKTSIAIVGTRSPSNYGRIVTDRLAGELASSGVVIVSGLAYGIDSIAHRKALEVGGKTIAVLGSGFNQIYPASHTALSQEIANKGLLISEYCPSTKATKFTFPMRNRIVAGLSEGVLITEAGTKSGTVHTKDFALDYGRMVFAVPGNIDSEKSSLPNQLIKSCQSKCVTDSQDILDELGESKVLIKKSLVAQNMELGEIEQKIVDLLKNGEKDVDFICENCNLSVISLNSYLTTMEISGLIRRMPGGSYCLG